MSSNPIKSTTLLGVTLLYHSRNNRSSSLWPAIFLSMGAHCRIQSSCKVGSDARPSMPVGPCRSFCCPVGLKSADQLGNSLYVACCWEDSTQFSMSANGERQRKKPAICWRRAGRPSSAGKSSAAQQPPVGWETPSEQQEISWWIWKKTNVKPMVQ